MFRVFCTISLICWAVIGWATPTPDLYNEYITSAKYKKADAFCEKMTEMPKWVFNQRKRVDYRTFYINLVEISIINNLTDDDTEYMINIASEMYHTRVDTGLYLTHLKTSCKEKLLNQS